MTGTGHVTSAEATSRQVASSFKLVCSHRGVRSRSGQSATRNHLLSWLDQLLLGWLACSLNASARCSPSTHAAPHCCRDLEPHLPLLRIQHLRRRCHYRQCMPCSEQLLLNPHLPFKKQPKCSSTHSRVLLPHIFTLPLGSRQLCFPLCYRLRQDLPAVVLWHITTSRS